MNRYSKKQITAIEYLKKVNLLSNNFKEEYNKNMLSYICNYKMSEFIIDNNNLLSFISFCNACDIYWYSGDNAKEIFMELIENKIIDINNGIAITMYIYRNTIKMVYSTFIYKNKTKKFPISTYNKLIEI